MDAVKTHKASGGCCDKNCRDVAAAYVSFTTYYGLDGPVTDIPTIYYTKEKSKRGKLYLPYQITFNGLTIVKNDSCEPPVDPPSTTTTSSMRTERTSTRCLSPVKPEPVVVAEGAAAMEPIVVV